MRNNQSAIQKNNAKCLHNAEKVNKCKLIKEIRVTMQTKINNLNMVSVLLRTPFVQRTRCGVVSDIDPCLRFSEGPHPKGDSRRGQYVRREVSAVGRIQAIQ